MPGRRNMPPRPASRMHVLARAGALDVLAQHILGMACPAPFDPDALYAEVRSALPYAGLTRQQFDRVVELRIDGGYALKAMTLRQAEAGGRRQVARRPSALRPAIPLERRHHRRRAA